MERARAVCSFSLNACATAAGRVRERRMSASSAALLRHNLQSSLEAALFRLKVQASSLHAEAETIDAAVQQALQLVQPSSADAVQRALQLVQSAGVDAAEVGEAATEAVALVAEPAHAHADAVQRRARRRSLFAMSFRSARKIPTDKPTSSSARASEGVGKAVSSPSLLTKQ
jgi:hypothetical protein